MVRELWNIGRDWLYSWRHPIRYGRPRVAYVIGYLEGLTGRSR